MPEQAGFLDTVDEVPPTHVEAAKPVPTLTVLYMPDLDRVGEQASLGRVGSGRPVALSRLEPKFSSGSSKRPLENPRLSRKPLQIREARSGGLRIQRGDVRSTLLVDGLPLEEERLVSREELERGVILFWAILFSCSFTP